MKIFIRNSTSTLVTVVMLTSMANLHAAVVVDYFNSPVGGQTLSISNGIVGTSQNDVRTGLTVLGGSREIFLQLEAVYNASNFCSVNLHTTTSIDELSIANGSNVDSVCRLTWNANSGGLNTDLSAEYEFQLTTAHNDIPVAYTMTMQTFGGGTSTQTINTASNFTGNLTFAFSAFTAGVNLADVDSISLSIQGGRSSDVSMGALVAIPEPSSAVVALLGGLGVLVRRRRA
jgi:uncharacterized protein (TIGR03382 family)